MHKRLPQALAVALALVIPAVHATLPNITLTYAQPQGEISPTDPFDVWVHVDSDRAIGTSQGASFGFDVADLPASGSAYDPDSGQWVTAAFASYTTLSIKPGYGCHGNCSLFGYRFVEPAADDGRRFLDLAGAELRTGDFLLGTFVPAGTVQPGTYRVPLIPSLTLNVQGLSASGLLLNAHVGSGSVIRTCAVPGQGFCDFSRTVTMVPEPGTMAYALTGLALLAAARARRTWARLCRST